MANDFSKACSASDTEVAHDPGNRGDRAIAAIVALAAATRAQLSVDRSGAYWIRAGAACGLTAVALQSLWETGLVMPANAALAAVIAAIASYEREAAV